MPEKQLELASARTLDLHANDAQAVVASLRAAEPSSAEVFEAFWQLDALPVDDVKAALAAWVGPLPDLDRLDPATRRAHGLPLPRLRLRTLSVARDADVLDLGPLAEEQLRLAGKSWDGADLAPEDRLDGELEGSFAGTLERRVLADASAPGETPLFDVVLFAGDSGVVFAAGTTNVVALIAYRRVETRDKRTRSAIEEALAAHGEAPAVEIPQVAVVEIAQAPAPAVVVAATEESVTTPLAQASDEPEDAGEETIPEKAIVKPPVAKKAVVKKAAAKKTAAQKPVAKKTATKKVLAKKVPAKKASAKTAAKKAPAKKAPAKKTKAR